MAQYGPGDTREIQAIAIDCIGNKVTNVGTWTNSTGHTMYVNRASVLSLAIYGLVADVSGTLVRNSDGAMAVLVSWDHYQPNTGAESGWTRHAYPPGHYLTIFPGDGLTLSFSANAFLWDPNPFPIKVDPSTMSFRAVAVIDFTYDQP